MPHTITRIAAVDAHHYTVDCWFDQESAPRRVPLADFVTELAQAPQLAELARPDFFAQVSLAPYGTLVWPNEVDFCPDVLYAQAQPLTA